MPRPLRIEYENAYYHVMNRGRGRQKVFHGAVYFEAFLDALSEAHQRFDLQILCYCLMSNHYHLLVKTPEANLGRAMRHINGVYTQRHNRLKRTDGPLFRGRYKAISIEEDSYQLNVSRYIHRNPLEANMVGRLADYPWSSYPAYLKQAAAPEWLDRQEIYEQLGVKSRFAEKYQAYVESGIDEETQQFYSKGNIMPYLGSEAFRDWLYKRKSTDEAAITHQARQLFRTSIDEIVDTIADEFSVSTSSIYQSQRGKVANNIPRWVAFYLSRDRGGHHLSEIARAFGLKRTGSIPTTIRKLEKLMESDTRVLNKVNRIKRQYDT
ncbi:MAG: transposase [Gammaproteobacteria bacterium]|nr:transposase [Gammaproteobacteria bacterium]